MHACVFMATVAAGFMKTFKLNVLYNFDDSVQPSSLPRELEETWPESIQEHTYQLLTGWLFFRKVAVEFSRVEMPLDGVATFYESSAAECLMDYHRFERYLASRGRRFRPLAINPAQVKWPERSLELARYCIESLSKETQLLEDLERLSALAEKHCEFSLSENIKSKILRRKAQSQKNYIDLQQVIRNSE
ncbi:hypothetical protein N7537_010356 [Penicillium hordei]|uniref:Uncharacterized protein n=1 Tax=Penicillium hordei TaxID=40994 RepID=A0AAD6DUL9_9EURO|nr:uncharacterized protein N7537_010356 [Penicillium hordei]KAJ5593452.1 hypothetical protein N7537_010356 [Penicillium hordei]